ncbi:hypothetical protein [Bacillus toyonensis]|uniref:hypothetical protein n=1 Tax=Bacillus toyonensis TaxID=155322 RepID=UPI000BEF94C7|nr:hypothetical protein [Bacillus toyonensis]PEK06544.1 hypothetical protein CN681_25755 [Bacillus toyonensis]PEM09538.1 hypothetical protein CN616_30495 [Bacillus toyonensis]PGA44000.1 hypothetical protein COL85_19685 [Bacillus toyonensis]PGA55502.1 hypothetical protein COL86_13310 [Bacillus toyonensis]PGB26723.1 hypothetical protein COM06_13225 [Bacillus toyonensis]
MNIHTEEIVNQDEKSNEKTFTVANSYFQTVINNTESNWNVGKLLFDRDLYNAQGEKRAYLFQVQQAERKQGYVIVGVVDGTYKVLESAREGTHPYQGVYKDESIYLGLLSYYKKATSSKEIKTANQVKTMNVSCKKI